MQIDSATEPYGRLVVVVLLEEELAERVREHREGEDPLRHLERARWQVGPEDGSWPRHSCENTDLKGYRLAQRLGQLGVPRTSVSSARIAAGSPLPVAASRPGANQASCTRGPRRHFPAPRSRLFGKSL